MVSVTWARAAAWRMRRQHLEQRVPRASMMKVVSRICGLHAQVMSSAELTLWARVEGLDRAAVQKALWDKRTLVKTWAMRGTLHLLPAGELSMWHAALTTSRRYLRERVWNNYFGITLDDLDRLTQAIGTALEGRILTREELVDEIARVTGSAKMARKVGESSWGTILKPAAFSGRLCFAPGLGQRVRFTHPHSWLAAAGKSLEAMDTPAATAEVARRFFSANGPATYRDLARWWGGGTTVVRQWIAALGDELATVEVDGEKALMPAKHVDELREPDPKRSVRLLPGFDQYVVAASRHAERLLPEGLRARVYRPQGWLSPVLLVNGRMEGTWRHEVKGSRLEVSINPFGKAPPWARKAAEEEAERLAEYLGGKLNVKWS